MINAVLLTVYGISTVGVFLVAEGGFLGHVRNVLNQVRKPLTSESAAEVKLEEETVLGNPGHINLREKGAIVPAHPGPIRAPVFRPTIVPIPPVLRSVRAVPVQPPPLKPTDGTHHSDHVRRANNWLQSVQYVPTNDRMGPPATGLFALPLAAYITAVDCFSERAPEPQPLPFVKQKRLRELLLDDEFAALFFTGSEEIPQT